MELAFQEYLQRSSVGNYSKDAAVEYITNDEDIQSHWCYSMSTITKECGQELLKVLVQLLVSSH